MSYMTVRERAKRLAEYVQSLSENTSTESILSEFSQSNIETIGVDKRTASRSASAFRKAMTDESELSADDIIRAEAIVHKTKRPSHLIKNDRAIAQG